MKWEYKMFHGFDMNLLNEAGRKGWEAVCQLGGGALLLKRQLPALLPEPITSGRSGLR